MSKSVQLLTGYSRQALPQAAGGAGEPARALKLADRARDRPRRKWARQTLIFKLNSLVDPAMINLLYQASAVGVQCDLVVRGICCLRPGVPGLSEHIRVRSVVGRFLEHSRIFYFENGGEPEVYLGSADLMQRNLDRRVETLFPIEDPAMVAHIRTDLLAVYLHDNTRARLLQPDGSYLRAQPRPAEKPVDSQALFAAGREIPPE
ncbi:MAG: hypothetical protein U0Z44_13820 [Kouleothrix sp.]